MEVSFYVVTLDNVGSAIHITLFLSAVRKQALNAFDMICLFLFSTDVPLSPFLPLLIILIIRNRYVASTF